MSDATATLRIKAVMENSDVISNINQIQNRLEALKMPKDLTDRTKAKFEELTGLVKEYQNLMDKPHKSNADLRRLDQLNVQIKKIEKEAEKMIRSFDFSKIDTSEIDSAAIQKLNHELDETHKKIAQITKSSFNIKPDKGADSLLKQIKKIQGAVEETNSRKTKNLFQQLTEGIETGNIDKITSAVKELDKYLKPGAFAGAEGISKAFKEGGVSAQIHKIVDELQKADSEFMQTAHSAEQLEDAIKAEIANRLTEMAKEANQVGDGFRDASNAAEAYRESVTHAAKQQSEMQMQVQNLQQQIKNYFGLDEIFRKIGELARSAMDTVKELDAAMTETAVVTNFDVSDMWEMLPTYTKNANQLGSTIADVYNAATLYYQQGLTTTQSMALANETLKMARIGGIEAAEATDMMTAALRGFNMEINQASAQKINDVYSKLAAITAADTKEIGTAMERTASIAKSANMDFETTSAFLSQMIETTREAPENLGTAMKTIVARFQEMKVDPNSLVDSEGERLDFNRVDKALKSVGISLVDEQNQFRNLDDVFLEISSRWDGMTQAQQRYIATIAAGSRQQSRFIAMMQDYDRTLELVDAAYTAEGAGQAQFEKTLESMDSKLNRLKNAWDQFAMGFMNADFLKVGVDAGTKFLDIFEKIITGISKIGVVDPFQSLIKSALTATAVFGGLLAMSKLLMAGVGKFAGMVLGEEVAKKSTGVVGMGANMVYGPDDSKKALERKQAKEERNARIKELKALGKEEAKIRREGFETGFQEYKNNKQRGKLSNYFGELQAGSKAQKDIKNFQKQLNNMLSKGTFNQKGFMDAFSGMGRSAQIALMPQIKGAFDKAIQSANLDEEGKKAAQRIIDSANARFNSGKIDAHGMIDQIKNDLGQAGINPADVDIDLGNVAQQMAPMSKIGMQFERIGVGAAKAGQSIQMFGANLMGTPLAPFGTALMVVGQLTENLGMLMGSGITKIKAWGAAMVAVGAETALAGAEAGVATKFFAGLGKTIWMNLKPLLPYIAAVAAVAAAVGLIAYAATKNSRELKRQGDAAAQAGQDLDTTKQALEAVNNDLTELANNDNALDGLVKGTTEWNNQLAEANAHIIEMMGNYKTLNEVGEDGEYKYIQTDKDGRMSITQAGKDAIQKEYQNAVNMAAANNAVQGAIYNNLKDLNSKQYKDNQKLITQAQNSSRMGGEGWTDEAKRAKLENENIIKQNDARLENAWKVGIHSALADAGLVNQDAVETILTSQRDQLVDAVELGSRKANEERYAELMGYTRTDKGKYTDAQGNELTIDYKTVKEMLPEMEGMASAQEKATAVQSALTSAQTKLNNTLQGAQKTENLGIISDILSKSADINSDALRDFIGANGGQSNLDKFIDTFSKYYDEQDAKILSALTGMEVDASNYTKALDTLESTLKENADALVQQQEDSIKGVAGILDSIDWGGKTKNAAKREKISDANIKNLINSMETAQIESLARVSESMSDNFGDKMAQDYARTIADMYSAGTQEAKAGAEELENIMNNVDFSSSLATIEAFHKAASSNNKDVQTYGQAWKDTSEAALATSQALQEVYTSDDMAELAEDMATYIDEQGQLDATKILEMADASQSLQRYLDATGASAAGVAKAFTLIGNGEIAFSDLTPGVVAAANAMDQLSASTGRANKALETFEIKNDSGKYQDALTGNRDSLQEMADAGEWGNTAFQEVLSKIFGPDNWAKAYEKGKDGISDLFDKYKNITENGAEKVGEVADKLGDDLSFESLAKGIKESDWGSKLTDEAIDILINSATNTNVGLKRKLEASNPEQMQSEYIKATGLNTGGIGTSTDIANQARLYSSEADKQREYITSLAESLGVITDESSIFSQKMAAAGDDTDKMAEALGSATNKIINIDENMTGEQIAGKIQSNWREGQKEQGNYQAGDKWWKQQWAQNGQGGYDIQSIVKSLERMGLDSTKALDTAREIALKNQETEFTAGGEKLEKEDLADLNSFADKIQESLDKEQWVEVGKTIGEQIVEAWKNRNKEDEKENKTYSDLTKDQQKLYTGRNANDALARDRGIKGWDMSGIDRSGNFNKNFAKVIAQVAQEKSFTGQQKGNVAGTYLQNQTGNLVGKSGADIAKSIQTAAEQMKTAGMKNGEIAKALNTGYGLKGDNKVTAKELKFDSNNKLEVPLNFNNAKLEEQLANLHADIEATVNITSVTGMGFSGGSKASGQNNHRFGSFARGSRGGYRIPGRPTLTGEEGEELVWEPRRNEAFMVGSNGPQFANISRDAVVWNAAQTRRIKKNSSVTGFGTGARGINYFGTMGGGQHGGGAKGKSISGSITLDATANITEANPAGIEPVPVKAKLDVEGAEKGGLVNKIKGLFGKGEKGTTIKVRAEATKVDVNEKAKTIKVTGTVEELKNNAKKLEGVKATATVTGVKKGKQVSGEPVKVKATAVLSGKTSGQTATVKTKADNTAQRDINSIKRSGVVLVKTKADNAAQRAINAIKGTTAVVHIKPSFEGNWTKNAIIHVNHDAKGQNNYIAHRTAPSFGSAAAGPYGRVGPRGKGGLTLTGEEGFEIAWIPNENRSMILGAKGPQMLFLPKDAVVYTHEQSERILKQRSIPAGSHKKKSKKKSKTKTTRSGSTIYKTKGKTREVIPTGEISSYIFNLEQKIAAVKLKQEQAQKKLNKQLEIGYNTLKDIKEVGNEDAKRIQQSVNLNKNLVDEYNNQLKALDQTGKTTIKWTNKQQKKKKGKWKGSGNKEHSESINLGNYIKVDPDTGAYVVDYDKINKEVGSKDKNKAAAIKEAAEQKISDLTSKRDSAQNAYDDAQEKMTELGKQLYEQFYGWENELTKILKITTQISELEKHTSKVKSAASLQEAMVAAGYEAIGDSLKYYKAQLASLGATISKRDAALKEQADLVIKAISVNDEWKDYTIARDANAADAINVATLEARRSETYEKFRIAREAQKYIWANVNTDGTAITSIDTAALEKDYYAGRISKEMYEGIKKYYDTITEQSGKLQELYESQLSDLTELYDLAKDLKEQYADRSEELLDSVEQAQEEEVKSLEDLNDALTDALKDLLDGVRDKLDERRRQEDNQKTERDISRQQQRLAALRADTSGGHQVEIAQLEKEIAEAQQSYGRTLEDQRLDALQKQADEASKQRQQQIDILSSQLEQDKKNGNNLALVREYLSDPARYEQQIKAAWMSNKDYKNQTEQRQAVLDDEWAAYWSDVNGGLATKIDDTTQAIDAAKVNLNNIEANTNAIVQSLLDKSTRYNPSDANSIKNALADNLDLRAAIDDLRMDSATDEQIKAAVSAAGLNAKDIQGAGFNARQAYNWTGASSEELIAAGYTEDDLRAANLPVPSPAPAPAVNTSTANNATSNNNDKKTYTDYLSARKRAKSITSEQINKLFTYGSKIGKGKKQVLSDIIGGAGADPFTWKNTLKAVLNANGINRWNLSATYGKGSAAEKAVFDHFNINTNKKKKDFYKNSYYKAFMTGGLADYTGPAWLDGTPSKPELVLNAADTKNFLALKDVLSKAIHTSNSVSNSYGDASYEININVDHLNNDYDVDRVAERVKKIIVKDAGYRNVNQVRNFR